MRPCVIFDIDGTLSDPSHRLHFVTGRHKDYDSFFAKVREDGVHFDIVTLANVVYESYHVILVSGRPETIRDTTVAWLRDHGVPFTHLYMRKAGDHRNDVVVKREILEQIRKDGYEPWLVIDDRPKVVEMWREAGLTCLALPYQEHADPSLKDKLLLTLMVGPSGAGKTTMLADHYGTNRRNIISSDDVRADLFGDFRSQEDNARVFRAVHGMARERMRHGLHTVIDATNLRRKDRLACVACAPVGAKVQYVVVDRPLEDKIRDRGWRPEALIRKHDQTFRSQEKEILRGDDLPQVTVLDVREGRELQAKKAKDGGQNQDQVDA